jgi:hypothetical protein
MLSRLESIIGLTAASFIDKIWNQRNQLEQNHSYEVTQMFLQSYIVFQ